LAGRAAVIAVALVLELVACRDALAARWLIEPGQETVLAAMLGGSATLPGECRLESASVDKSVVVAQYACADGRPRVELHHPSQAPPAAARTERFAVVLPPQRGASQAFVDALVGRIRAREGEFRWTPEGRTMGHSPDEAGARGAARPMWVAWAAPAGFVLFFALPVAIACRLFSGGGRREPTPRVDLRKAGLVAALSFAWLAAALPASPVHPDTTRDFLMAARCLGGLPCDRGPPASLGVFVQGALWTRFLAVAAALHLGATGVQVATSFLQAVGAAVAVVAARRLVPPATAAWIAAAWTVLGAIVSGAPVLWNPTLVPLPLALFGLSLVALADGGPLAAAAAAGASLALAADCHVLASAFVPVLVAATVACARRPIPSTLAALAALALVWLLDSPAACAVNAHALLASGAGAPLGAMLLLAALSGAAARSRLGTIPVHARACVFLATGAALAACAAAAVATATGHAAAGAYFAAALPAGAVACGVVADFTVRRLARALGVHERRLAVLAGSLGALALVAAWRARWLRAGDPAWTMADACDVAPPLYARLGSFGAIQTRLETRSRALVAAMTIFEPPPSAAEGIAADDDLLLFKAPHEHPPPPGPWLATVDLGRDVALIGSIHPFLDRTRIRACYRSLDDDPSQGGCIGTGVDPRAVEAVEPDERAYPELPGVRDAFPASALRPLRGVHESFEVRLAPGPGPAHRVEVFEDDEGWTIERIERCAHRGPLPAPRAIVEGDATEGVLVVGRRTPAGHEARDRYWLPPIIEIAETDRELVDAIERRAVF
jgi:hypothetical protein